MVFVETSILTSKTPNKGASSAVEFFKSTARATLLTIVFGGVIPARILTHFGYDVDFLVALSAGFVAALSLRLVMFAVRCLLGSLAERGFTDARSSSEFHAARRVLAGCLVSLFLMVLFGAMGVGVGFLHAALAYVAPVWAWFYVWSPSPMTARDAST